MKKTKKTRPWRLSNLSRREQEVVISLHRIGPFDPYRRDLLNAKEAEVWLLLKPPGDQALDKHCNRVLKMIKRGEAHTKKVLKQTPGYKHLPDKPVKKK